MDIPNLPTDNLYKFLAISGLALFMFSIYFGPKNSINIHEDIDNILSQITVLQQDSNKFQAQIEDLKEKKYILFDYLMERYTDLKETMNYEKYKDYLQLVLENKSISDSILAYNALYSISLRIPEFRPYYYEYKNLYDEYLKVQIEYNKNILEKQEQLKLLGEKNTINIMLSILFTIVGLIGGYFSIKGFSNWYYKIQIYQDETLKKSIEPPLKSKENGSKI